MDGNGLFHRGVKNHQRAAGLLVVLLFCTNCIQPTGNLDGENSRNVVELLTHLAHNEGYCVIIVTHDPAIAEASDVVYRMTDGILEQAS